MGRIAVLPPAVQGQIAAGEVIERPASIVKELVENAIDAGARHVDVVLEDGGVGGLLVRDDGIGMTPDDAELAFARHATSKLRAADDLEQVGTFGFRGEALPSIAAAGRVILRTRDADAATGSTIEASEQGVSRGAPIGMPQGTVVEVRDLFARAPARRKFLRQPATELGHAVDTVTRLAVAYPHIGMRVTHDRRFVLDLPPVDGLRARLVQVLGRARAESLVEIHDTLGDYEVSGFLGSPRDTLGSPRLVWTYVRIGSGGDGGAPRWIRDRLLLRAVLDGYETLIMRGRYPICVLTVGLPPGSVDVNVHPAKLEVRFRDTRPIHRVVSETIRRGLTAALGGQREGGGSHASETEGLLSTGAGDRAAVDGGSDAVGEPRAREETSAPSMEAPGDVAEGPSRPYAVGGEEARLEQRELWQAAPEGFGGLRFVAQVFEGYLLCDAGNRLVLLDQHAAHERVLYERLVAESATVPVERDELLVPETITVGTTELAHLAEHADMLTRVGLEGEAFGENTYLLRTIPRALRGRDVGELVRAIAADLVSEGVSRAADRMLDRVMATMACHAATRVGQRLDVAAATALLEQMDGVAVNAHCPHGRPVAVQLARAQIEALFGR